MGADLSRIRSNPLLDFAGVELKQGGVLLDADFNEFAAVVDRRLRAAASDILGRATVSATTPDAFKLTPVTGGLMIGRGRLYVDGLLAENHGGASTDPAKLFDPLLAEPVIADAITYTAQPFLPGAPELPKSGRHLVYLDVWDREVTHLEQPDLIEPAVGVESSSRRQTVWQVRVLGDEAPDAGCTTPDDAVPGWADWITPSTGRLTTGTFDVLPKDDPCDLPPTGGYRGPENQTYRVEIHDPGKLGGGATFKWSRENASVGSRVASVVSPIELELQTLGRDDVLRFNTGDWVEIIDDVREFSQACGEMRKITGIKEAARRVTFTESLPPEMLPDPGKRNLRVRRWDQKGKVLSAGPGSTTPVFQDLDAATSSGVINVPAGTTLILENGVTVSFASAKGFRAGDHWVFAARTADASVEPLTNAPPRGIHHHYARLGLWDVNTGSVTDCRTPWPPRGEGHDCSCTECVTAELHASNPFAIQAAVDRLHVSGGTVCLGVGQYVLKRPVRLENARSVRIRGQGAATLLVAPNGAFSVVNGVALAVEDLAVLSVGHASAITVRTALGLSLQRLIVLVLGGNAGHSAAIALSGVVVGATIRDNLLIAPVAVLANEPGSDTAARFLLSALLRIEDNAMWCEHQAVSLAGLSLHLMATRITGNEILGCREGGVAMLGLAAPGATVELRANSLNVSGPGIVAGTGGLWIADNKLNASTPGAKHAPNGAGIHLRAGLDPNGADQCQVLANQIAGFEDAAILIESPTRDLIVKLNLIERCGNGIVLRGEAQAESVSIENNHLSDIGLASAGAGAEVLGIGVQNATAATIAGNTVRRVGLEASQPILCAGVATAAVQRLRVAGNDVTDIGPPGKSKGGLVAGVVVRAPFEQADVNHNHVDRESQPPRPLPPPPDEGGFTALRAEALSEKGAVSRIGAYTTLWVDSTTTLTVGAKRPIIHRAAEIDVPGAVVVRGSSISVLGNTLASRGGLPVVQIVTTGDCLFSDNRCELRGQGPGVAVELSAGAIIVNANRVRSGGQSSGGQSLVIGGITAKATVLGNITTTKIVFGDLLDETPWGPFNLHD